MKTKPKKSFTKKQISSYKKKKKKINEPVKSKPVQAFKYFLPEESLKDLMKKQEEYIDLIENDLKEATKERKTIQIEMTLPFIFALAGIGLSVLSYPGNKKKMMEYACYGFFIGVIACIKFVRSTGKYSTNYAFSEFYNVFSNLFSKPNTTKNVTKQPT